MNHCCCCCVERDLSEQTLSLQVNNEGVDLAYIGLIDIETEGAYVWSDNSALTVDHIGAYHLDSWSSAEARDCGAFNGSSSEWVSTHCCFNPHSIGAVVCERRAWRDVTQKHKH